METAKETRSLSFPLGRTERVRGRDQDQAWEMPVRKEGKRAGQRERRYNKRSLSLSQRPDPAKRGTRVWSLGRSLCRLRLPEHILRTNSRHTDRPRDVLFIKRIHVDRPRELGEKELRLVNSSNKLTTLVHSSIEVTVREHAANAGADLILITIF